MADRFYGKLFQDLSRRTSLCNIYEKMAYTITPQDAAYACERALNAFACAARKMFAICIDIYHVAAHTKLCSCFATRCQYLPMATVSSNYTRCHTRHIVIIGIAVVCSSRAFVRLTFARLLQRDQILILRQPRHWQNKPPTMHGCLYVLLEEKKTITLTYLHGYLHYS